MKPAPLFETRSPGKVLLSAEYFVLDGALALALPCQLGQSLKVFPLHEESLLHWESYDPAGGRWFEGRFRLPDLKPLAFTDAPTAERLRALLQAAQTLQPAFLQTRRGRRVRTELEFPLDWGLGSSSTLVAALARWAGVSPFALLEKSFGGSGYDLACAEADGPILFQRTPEPWFERVSFHPPFRHRLFFLHLGRKQDSRQGIARYRKRVAHPEQWTPRFSSLTRQLLSADDPSTFEALLREHERLVGELLGCIPLQLQRFSDFPGAVKSLGAWGGDFALVSSPWDAPATERYFARKGLHTLLPYDELIL